MAWKVKWRHVNAQSANFVVDINAKHFVVWSFVWSLVFTAYHLKPKFLLFSGIVNDWRSAVQHLLVDIFDPPLLPHTKLTRDLMCPTHIGFTFNYRPGHLVLNKSGGSWSYQINVVLLSLSVWAFQVQDQMNHKNSSKRRQHLPSHLTQWRHWTGTCTLQCHAYVRDQVCWMTSSILLVTNRQNTPFFYFPAPLEIIRLTGTVVKTVGTAGKLLLTTYLLHPSEMKCTRWQSKPIAKLYQHPSWVVLVVAWVDTPHLPWWPRSWVDHGPGDLGPSLVWMPTQNYNIYRVIYHMGAQ